MRLKNNVSTLLKEFNNIKSCDVENFFLNIKLNVTIGACLG